MNRALAVIAEWEAAVSTGTTPRDAKIAELEETVAKLKQKTAKLRTHNADLERLNKAAATVIAELHAQLQATRNEVPTGTVAVLKGRQSRRYVCK